MNLLQAYSRKYPGGFLPERLGRILRNEDPLVSVKHLQNGIIILSNGKVLRCVNNYYRPVSEENKIRWYRNTKNPHLYCQSVRNYFDLNHIPDMGCTFCHLDCLQLEKENKLELLSKKVNDLFSKAKKGSSK